MRLRRINLEDCEGLAASFTKPYHQNYFAMYTSVLGGVVTDPFLMTVPMDDHMVHRGDGIFEVFKCVEGRIYNLQRHLERLERSARAIYLQLPVDLAEMTRIVVETIQLTGQRDALIRLFVSRGPGGFTTDPYECPASQLYVMVGRLNGYPRAFYSEGVRAKSSSVPVKKSYFANIKSCNYLPNVLMKKEAVDNQVEFTVSVDENGFLGEGSTENVGVVMPDGRLRLPRFSRILQGTTVMRATELAEALVAAGTLQDVVFEDITLTEAYSSAEMLLFGTTFDILPVVAFDRHPIGKGAPGPVFRGLRERLRWDMYQNPEAQTPVFTDGARRNA
jgi:branched-chain amino acid aminotransferase